MTDLEPNSPKKRIQYVIDTYRGSKSRAIIPEVVEVSLMLLGRDYPAYRLAQKYEPLWQYLWAGERGPLHKEMRSWSPPIEPEDAEAYIDVLFDRMPDEIDRFTEGDIPAHHPHESMIPWIAKELGRLMKAVRQGNATGRDYEEAVDALKRKGPALGMWVTENNIDLTKMPLADALEAIKGFEVEVEVEPGEVVYTFNDGYTVQKLTTKEQLDDEGEAMQHCVAGYCPAVKAGAVEVYSLRDANGKPHATMEVDAMTKGFTQVQGKQNEAPVEKYRPYLEEFINEEFSGDIPGLLMSGIDARKAVLRQVSENGVLRDVIFADFEGMYEWKDDDGKTHTQVNLNNIDLSGVKIEDVSFVGAEMNGAKFEGSELENALFYGVELNAARFRGATIIRCVFAQAKMEDVDFYGARIVDSDFEGAILRTALFARANISGTDFGGALLHDADFEGAVLDAASYNYIGEKYQVAGWKHVNWRGALIGNVIAEAMVEEEW